MQIALVSIGFPPYYTFGGAESYVSLLSEELAKNGINITVIAGWPKKETLCESPRDRVKVIRLPVIDKPPRSVWYQLLNKNNILNIINRADVVHCNSLVTSLINDKIMNEKPLIITMHGSLSALCAYFSSVRTCHLSIGDLFYLMEYPLISGFYRRDLLHSDALIFVAHHAYNEAMKYLGDKCKIITSKSVVIYPGINLNEIRDKRVHTCDVCNEIEMAYVGRLFWPKGITYTLETFNIIVNEMGEKTAKLHILGEGPLRSWVSWYVKKHGLAKNINIYGQVSRDFVLQTLSKTKVLLSPSLYEGCPYVLLEANALGVPVVTFDFDWSREFITNGLNGFRSPLVDVHKLAEDALKATSLNTSLIREEAKKFDIRITAKKTIETYKKLL